MNQLVFLAVPLQGFLLCFLDIRENFSDRFGLQLALQARTT